jgi:hypothetical protein
MPVLGGTGLSFRSVRGAGSRRLIGVAGSGSGSVIANPSSALGGAESCRSRDDAGVATRKNVGEVTAAGTGQDLATSEMVQECSQGVETETHGAKKKEGGVIKSFNRCRYLRDLLTLKLEVLLTECSRSLQGWQGRGEGKTGANIQGCWTKKESEKETLNPLYA